LFKLSNYNIVSNYKDKIIIYNTFSNGILELVKPYSSQWEEFIDKQDSAVLSNELIENLIKGNFILDEKIDETKKISVFSKLSRFDNSSLSLTIAPTLECNFACPYCYEKNRRYNKMNSNVIEKTIEFIDKNIVDKKNLNICWYGGEPLLALDSIINISEKVLEKDISYSSSIVTNGYLLNREEAEILKKYHVMHAQITLDGPPKIHDARRKLLNGEGSFNTILNNICDVYDIIPITIRINLDKQNHQYLDELFFELDKRNLQNKIHVYIAPVSDINATCSSNSCFKSNEFASEEIDFLNQFRKRGYTAINVPKANFDICGAVSPYSFIIDPLGDLYKCWDDIGNKNEVFGNIESDYFEFNYNLLKWLSYDPIEEIECHNCSMLPICMGGCPNYIIKNHSEKTCIPIKYTPEKYLELFINNTSI